MRGSVSRDTERRERETPREEKAHEGCELPHGITVEWKKRTRSRRKTLKWSDSTEVSLQKRLLLEEDGFTPRELITERAAEAARIVELITTRGQRSSKE
jgi:hypothetical protein